MESLYFRMINLLNLREFQVILDPFGIFIVSNDHFLNIWDLQVIWDARGFLVSWEDQSFESFGFASNFGSAWNLGTFGRSIY